MSTPKNLSLWWNIGSLLGICIMIQIFSGMFLTMYYDYTQPFFSIWNIHLEIKNGWILHYVHLNFSSIIFLFMFLHFYKAILMGSFCKKSKYMWMSGIILMLLLMMIAFLGYVLPWGQMSLWGATVITNLLTVLPYGKFILKFIWGGYFISKNTVKIFYTLHFILPFLLLVIIIIHLIILHYSGSSNSLGLGNNNNFIKQEFMNIYFYKDLLNIMIILTSFFVIFLNPYIIADKQNFILANNMLSPVHIKPEWYFLHYYGILRAIPNKMGGVLTMLCAIMMLFLMFLLKTKINLYPLKFWKFLSMFFFIIIWILARYAKYPMEQPFIWISQFMSCLYFMWFILIFFFFKSLF